MLFGPQQKIRMLHVDRFWQARGRFWQGAWDGLGLWVELQAWKLTLMGRISSDEAAGYGPVKALFSVCILRISGSGSPFLAPGGKWELSAWSFDFL